ncbi:MAG: hypothetical protein QOH56_2842 [Pseudonocardiales bacterium]|jgi:hypothetical protein|nr:hypothetical protein [Pseudonocardiales bacterium]
MDEYKLEIWTRGATEPVTVVMPDEPGASSRDRFHGVCDAVEIGRASGAALRYVTWQDVGPGGGFTIDPADTIEVKLIGPDGEESRTFD